MLMIALPLALLAAQATPEATTLNLRCTGSGSVRKGGGIAVSGLSMGGVSSTAPTESSFYGAVEMMIAGTTGTATLPPEMLGDGRSAPRNPRTIKALAVGTDLIEGDLDISSGNQPHAAIDRRNGTLTVSGGKASFTGTCEAFDPAKVERKF